MFPLKINKYFNESFDSGFNWFYVQDQSLGSQMRRVPVSSQTPSSMLDHFQTSSQHSVTWRTRMTCRSSMRPWISQTMTSTVHCPTTWSSRNLVLIINILNNHLIMGPNSKDSISTPWTMSASSPLTPSPTRHSMSIWMHLISFLIFRSYPSTRVTMD